MQQRVQKTRRGIAKSVRRHASFPTTPKHTAPRVSIVMKRQTALGAAWVTTVALAAVVGWFGGQRVSSPIFSASEERPLEQGIDRPAASSPRFEEVRPGAATDVGSEFVAEPVAERHVPTEPPTVDPVTQPPPATPSPATPDTDSTPDVPPDEPVMGPVAVLEPAEPAAPAVVISESFERAAGLAERGDHEGARAEAEALLAEYGDYSGLIEAFRESGAGETRARLDALRVLQLGGLQMISVELARDLKRSYAGSAVVLDAIRDWRILKPSVTTLDSSIVEGHVVVQGHVANPDVGAVRRVIIEIEALDAGGNAVAKTTTRVRPKSLDSGAAGSFTAKFDAVDPASVLRVRATVVKWDSEVFE